MMTIWKWLHPFAQPQTSYQLACQLQKVCFSIGWGLFLIGLYWGLFQAPADYQQGDAFRIIYVHVPAALVSMISYVIMALSAFVVLVWRMPLAGFMIPAIAPVGAIFTLIALATGAIWGKPMWGTWWVWDARLTSELILLFLFVGVGATYHVFEDKKQAAKAAGALAVVGVINLPIIHFSVEWWHTLHQGSTLLRWGGPAIASEMLWPLLIMIASFTLLMLGMSLLRFSSCLLAQESRRGWVHKLMKENAL